MQTVAVVDDHTVLTQLLSSAIDAEPDLRVVGSAHSLVAGLDLVERTAPDVVVMDVRLDDGDGVAATSELTATHPATRVIMLTAVVDEALPRRASDAGACAVLAKTGELDTLLQAIRTSERAQSGAPSARGDRGSAPEHPGPGALSSRELHVLRLLATGMDVKQISVEMQLPLRPCRTLVASVLDNLGARSGLEAAAVAMSAGLLDAYVDD